MAPRYRIEPGSPLDTALNLLVDAETGEREHDDDVDAAVAVVTDAREQRGSHVTAALGMRVWLATVGRRLPASGRAASDDEVAARWFGGVAA